MRRYTWALAILCFLVILLAAPLLISDRYSRIALQSGAVFAASTNSYSLSSPVRLMTGPTIDLESGTLSVPPSRTGLARGGQMIAMLITGGEITTVTSSRYDDQGAHIGVGYRNPAGQLATAAVLHLLQYSGNGTWEVVGSGDTTLSLEQPAYGSAVSSPMTVGGHITGVDENIRTVVRSRASGVVGSSLGHPAGGQATPWYDTVSFTGSGVLTVVASTGGHLQAVERFAIQGVHR